MPRRFLFVLRRCYFKLDSEKSESLNIERMIMTDLQVELMVLMMVLVVALGYVHWLFTKREAEAMEELARDIENKAWHEEHASSVTEHRLNAELSVMYEEAYGMWSCMTKAQQRGLRVQYKALTWLYADIAAEHAAVHSVLRAITPFYNKRG